MQTPLIGILMSVLAVSAVAADSTNGPSIVPLPKQVESCPGVFKLTAKTIIVADKTSEPTAKYLATALNRSTGLQLGVMTLPGDAKLSPKPEAAQIISISQAPDAGLGAEGYDLTVGTNSVAIKGTDAAGAFYGVQTLLQLLPPEVYSAKATNKVDWCASCVHVVDQPRFKWRGLMLDVARHFYSKDEVKRVLDEMAMHKLNVFHWHLVDDQGWRIEIKKYPQLTQVGAWRHGIGWNLDTNSSTAYGADGRYGGFYTQADIREVIAYADTLHITIVPEIEMPGHSTAALAAFPELSCSGGPYSTDVRGGVNAGVYCAGNDASFEFLQNVLAEVIELFPSKYIHIGGDEVPKGNWKKCDKCQARIKAEGLKDEKELQSYFIRRIEKYINSKGRCLLGWSEIREGGLAESAAMMDWLVGQGSGAVEAASAGHDVVMSPTSMCYFDYYQSTNRAGEPKAIGNFLPVEKTYAFEPIPATLDAKYQSHIIGGQGNLWTEWVPNLKHAEYMLYPRLSALSEAVWSPKEARNFGDFKARMQVQFTRFDRMGVNYRPFDKTN